MPVTKTLLSNTAIGTFPTIPSKAGYTFNGWFSTISGGVPITTEAVITRPTTHYAQWTEGETEPILSDWGDSTNSPMNYLLANRPVSQLSGTS